VRKEHRPERAERRRHDEVAIEPPRVRHEARCHDEVRKHHRQQARQALAVPLQHQQR